MALNPSGQISIGGPTVGQSINLELNLSATANSSLDQANFRNLAGVPAGAISLSNFYGKSNIFQRAWIPRFAPGFNTTYIEIPTLGNQVIFGALSPGRNGGSSSNTSSLTKGFMNGGTGTGPVASPVTSAECLQYTYASAGTATAFGNLTVARSRASSNLNSTTRSITAGGNVQPSPTGTTTIDYFSTASLGNSIFFGNLGATKVDTEGGASSPTRGIVFGGRNSPTSANSGTDAIQYVTIATLGNAISFGVLLGNGRNRSKGAASNTTRALTCCAVPVSDSPTAYQTIQYVTIATTGNAAAFGNLVQGRENGMMASNAVTAIAIGGSVRPNGTPQILNCDYVSIATLGNGTLFGTLLAGGNNNTAGAACSSYGGGLQ